MITLKNDLRTGKLHIYAFFYILLEKDQGSKLA